MEIDEKIDIVVVNWNAGDLLKRCIQSVLDSEESQLLGKITIVDNASADDKLQHLLPNDSRIHIIQNTVNKGFAFACNQGIQITTSQYVVMLNPDVKLNADTLSGSFHFMEAHPEVDILGVKQLDEKGETWASTSRFPKPYRFWNDALGLSKIFPRFFKPATLMTDWDHQSSGYVDQVMGSYMFIRRTVFDRIGLFDTRYFVYYEEIDLSKRLADVGGKSFYNHTIQLLHTGNGTTEKVKAFRLFLSINSRLLYSKKHFSWIAQASTLIVSLSIEPMPRIFFSLLKGGFVNALDTVKGYGMIWRQWVFGKKIL